MRRRRYGMAMTSGARCLAVLLLFCALDPQPLQAEPLVSSARPRSGGLTPAAEVPSVLRCPRAAPVRGHAVIESDDIDELSGLTASRTQPGVFWVHNDSGDKGRLFAIDLRGKLLLELALSNVKPRDVEDIAVGPRYGGKGHYLYLADTGDNHHDRERVLIYRLEEPDVVRDFVVNLLAQS